MKFKISATVPVVQYGNIIPEIEVEAETFEEAYALVMPKLERIWNTYVEDGKQLSTHRTKLKAFVGGEVYYDDLTHTYTNEAGEVYLSGSQYAKQFEKPFDKQTIAKAMADKIKADPKTIIEMWELKAEISRGFGTAMHKALELYGRFDGLAKQLERTTNLHDHPIIKKAVESFYEGRRAEIAEYEVFVVNHDKKHAGQIDRLLLLDAKTCRVQDFKTNTNIEKSLPSYWKQLEFYGNILEAGGYTVLGYDLFHWNGEWQTLSKENENGRD